MKKYLLKLFLVTSCIFITGCVSKGQITKMFDAFDAETTQDIAYVRFDSVITSDIQLDLRKVLEKNEIDGYFREVYVIQDNLIWFGFSKKGIDNEKWSIASVNSDGSNFNVAYSGEFCFDSEADQSYEKRSYIDVNEYHMLVNGFYYDGKITLTDHVKTIEFDLTSHQIKEIPITQYHYPDLSIGVDIIDYHTILFKDNSTIKEFNLTTGEESSEVFKEMLTLKEKMNWENLSYLSYLFDQVQIVNNQIYIICRVINWDGETHAIIYEYDFKNNSCKYVFHCFMDDVISGRLYIVPMI